jgi:hypothetical protein
MGDRGVEIHLDGDTSRFTFTFADDIALALALGSTVPAKLEAPAVIAATGAASFVVWVGALVRAFQEANEIILGEPIIRRKPGDAKEGQ